ncbi:MAG: hypothetical protein KGY74_08095 [Candidatus Cloacimonetes bacterium]|nr:hypothetical protein [Candidatus Cloacimonadota bacterium]
MLVESISPQEVENLSEFLENENNDVYGFTVTLKSGEIRNFFIKCNLTSDCKKLEDLRNYYKKLKKLKKKN